MKIIHTKGLSFTTLDETADGQLARGLLRLRKDTLTPARYAESTTINPSRLPAYIVDDYDLAIRQTVSVLDKVIRKPRNLRHMHLDTYVDRTRLSVALWDRLNRAYSPAIRAAHDGDRILREFQKAWLWKVHPYAQYPFSERDPQSDKNAEIITRFGDKARTRADANGRWHDVFWKVHGDGRPDYPAIADGIWSHLFENELKINGWSRTADDAEEEASGLVVGRASSIVTSASDPRQSRSHAAKEKRKKLRQWRASDSEGSQSRADRVDVGQALNDPEVLDRYFYDDVAATICASVIESIAGNQFYPRKFGSFLYDHFKEILDDDTIEAAKREALWALHNAIRSFLRLSSDRSASATRLQTQRKMCAS